MKTVTRSAPPKMTRARAASASDVFALSETSVSRIFASTSEAVFRPSTTSATTKITTISTLTSSTNITTESATTTTTTTGTTIPTTTFLILPTSQPIRQPPPTPSLSTHPLDLDTLEAAGSVSDSWDPPPPGWPKWHDRAYQGHFWYRRAFQVLKVLLFLALIALIAYLVYKTTFEKPIEALVRQKNLPKNRYDGRGRGGYF